MATSGLNGTRSASSQRGSKQRGSKLHSKLHDEECDQANHRQPASVHFDIVEPDLVSTWPCREAQWIEAEVPGTTISLVLHAREIAICLALLQVELSQRLDAKAQGEHRALNLVQAQRGIQIVHGTRHPQLLQNGLPVRRLEEDSQESGHGKTTVFDLGLAVVVIGGLRHRSFRCVKDAGANRDVQWVEAQVCGPEPGIGEVPVALGVLALGSGTPLLTPLRSQPKPGTSSAQWRKEANPRGFCGPCEGRLCRCAA